MDSKNYRKKAIPIRTRYDRQATEQPSAGAVADHCVAQLLADGNAHPIAAQAVAPGVQDHIAIGKALGVIKALEYVVQFQAAGKLHCYFS